MVFFHKKHLPYFGGGEVKSFLKSGVITGMMSI